MERLLQLLVYQVYLVVLEVELLVLALGHKLVEQEILHQQVQLKAQTVEIDQPQLALLFLVLEVVEQLSLEQMVQEVEETV